MYTIETPNIVTPHLLFLTQLLPYPLDSGAKVRAYYMLRYLTQHHQVTLVSFVREDNDQSAVDHLRSFCEDVHCVPMPRSVWRNVWAGVRGLVTGRPVVIVRDEIGAMYRLLAHLMEAEAYDLVHADQTSMAGYGLWAAAQAQTHRPATVLDQHNAVYLLIRRMLAEARSFLRELIIYREAQAFVRYEARLCRAYDVVLTVSEQDKKHLLALFSGDEQRRIEAKIVPVPIAVDPDRVQAVPYPVNQRQSKERRPPTILHVGTMFWPPNIAGVLWFARSVLPAIWAAVPDARFVVVGKNPPPEVCALSADPRIQVTGYVEELTPYLEDADLFVVPLESGGGMRVKILDAWLWGLPIVSTRIGAEGIHIKEGVNILIANNPATFAQAVIDLLTNSALNQRLRQTGRAWVEHRYAWPVVYAEIEGIYQRLLAISK